MTIELEGHRGALAIWPGNSLTGYAYAFGVGVSSIEIDVWLTSDGQLTVFHDDKVTVDGEVRRTWELPMAQIPISRKAQPEVREHRAPTLQETLALFRYAGATDVILDVEIKSPHTEDSDYVRALGTATAEALAPHLGEQALRVRSFDTRALEACAKAVPELERVGLIANLGPELAERGLTAPPPGFISPDVTEAIKSADALGLKGLAPHAKVVTPQWVQAAHAAGLRVISWGAGDTPETANALLDAGCDGLCVDDPATLRELLKSRGLDVPAQHPIELPFLQS